MLATCGVVKAYVIRFTFYGQLSNSQKLLKLTFDFIGFNVFNQYHELNECLSYVR